MRLIFMSLSKHIFCEHAGEESNHVLENGNDADVIIAVEVEGDIDQHDSQMITQEITGKTPY